MKKERFYDESLRYLKQKSSGQKEYYTYSSDSCEGFDFLLGTLESKNSYYFRSEVGDYLNSLNLDKSNRDKFYREVKKALKMDFLNPNKVKPNKMVLKHLMNVVVPDLRWVKRNRLSETGLIMRDSILIAGEFDGGKNQFIGSGSKMGIFTYTNLKINRNKLDLDTEGLQKEEFLELNESKVNSEEDLEYVLNILGCQIAENSESIRNLMAY